MTQDAAIYSFNGSGVAGAPERQAFLEVLGQTGEWVDRTAANVDPYTAAYCARNGWIEKRVSAQGARQYRITDAGFAALAPSVWSRAG